ncbi:MAG TPA: vitamin K epoxide reductase family protein [Nitrospiria bacterium]|nr:vitamin K epoxide reductase family protein [Nitrospiria bacterium]
MNSAKFFSSPSGKTPSRVPAAFLILSLIGFADATFLTVKHYAGGPLNCSIFEGCEKVTTGPYASLVGIPLSLLGAAYYLAIFLLTIAYLDTRRGGILYFTAGMTFVGFAASAWFVYLQLFVIRAVCPYCMVSALTSTVLFILGGIALRSRTPSEGG